MSVGNVKQRKDDEMQMKLWMKAAIAAAVYFVTFGLIWLMMAWMGASVLKFMFSEGFWVKFMMQFCVLFSGAGIGLLTLLLFCTVCVGSYFFHGNNLEKAVGVGFACLYSTAFVYVALQMHDLFLAAVTCWWQGVLSTCASATWFVDSVIMIPLCWLFAISSPFIAFFSPKIKVAIERFVKDGKQEKKSEEEGLVSAEEFFGEESK